MNRQFTKDFYTDVNFGDVANHSMVGVVGQSDFIGTSYLDVWMKNEDHTFATTAETLEISSTSANDTSAGSGVRTVLVISLDATWAEQTQVVSMNGTTPVVLTGTHRAVNVVVVASSGTAGKAGTAVGTITLKVNGGLTRSVIGIGLTSAFNSFYTVPLGKEALWVQTSLYTEKGEDVNVRARFRIGENGAYNIGGNAPIYQNTIVYTFKTGLLLPEKSLLFHEAKTDNAGPTTVTTVSELILRDT